MTNTPLILLLSTTLIIVNAESPIVQTSYGSIKGYQYTDQNGFTSEIFKKLPFASPPVGERRWKKPERPKAWQGTIDGTSFGPACAQRSVMYAGPETGFSEDCLNMNVYTSKECRESSAKCPVVYYIYGGNGVFESTMKFPDEELTKNFASQGVIIVTAAYRLGMFGIISLGDEEAVPSNLAIHDVIAALKFIQEEIHAFGGDMNRVTVHGHSAGGTIALILGFSPGVKDRTSLFQSVISMSGSINLIEEKDQSRKSFQIAKEIGCEGTAKEVIACMHNKTSDYIIKGSVTSLNYLFIAHTISLFPNNERALRVEEIIDEITMAAFKVGGPNVFAEKQLAGFAMAGELLPIKTPREIFTNSQPIRLMIGNTFYEIIGDDESMAMVAMLGVKNVQECYDKYLHDRKSGKFDTQYGTMAQMLHMSAGLIAKTQADNREQVYLYEYDYLEHAVHTDDISFIMGFHTFDKDENEEWLSNAYPKYFTNFIKGERPSPDWYPVKPNLMNYYSVNKSFTEDVQPHNKFGYQYNLMKYYEELMKFDDRVTMIKQMGLKSSADTRSIDLSGDFQSFLDGLTLTDAVIVFFCLLGMVVVLCAIGKCLTRFLCCCCKSKAKTREQEPLIRYV